MVEILLFIWKIFFWIVVGFGVLVAASTVLNIIQYRFGIFNNFYSPISQDPAASRKLELLMGKFAADELYLVEFGTHFAIFRDTSNNRNIKVVIRKKSYFYGCIIEPDVIPYVRPENKTLREFRKFMKSIKSSDVKNTNEVMIE